MFDKRLRGFTKPGRWHMSFLVAALLVAVAAPANAQSVDDQSVNGDVSDATVEVLVDLTVGSTSLTELATQDNRGQESDLALKYLQGAAREGALLDLAEIRLYQTESGMTVGITKDKAIEEVQHRVERLTIIDQKGVENVALQEEMGLLVKPIAGDDIIDPIEDVRAEVPMGFGSFALEGLSGNNCYWATATYDSDNTMYWWL